jgi:hypothetical protein
MIKSATDLSERIFRLQKEKSLEQIATLMNDLHISSGELVEYLTTKGSLIVSTADRLREINQTRKAARKRLAVQKSSLEKARQVQKEKREKLVETANEAKVKQLKVEQELVLPDIDLGALNLSEEAE